MGKYFVTGTDTGIGKTVFTALAVAALNLRGDKAGMMKPVQTGCFEREKKLVAPDLEFVQRCCGNKYEDEILKLMCPLRFRKPASPHLAAAVENRQINPEQIIDTYGRLTEKFDELIVEGAGGIMVPITEDYLMLDLMVELDIPVILVSRSGLGTINHTLLSLEVLAEKGVEIAGVFFNNPDSAQWTAVEKDNARIIKKIGNLDVTGRLPHIPELWSKAEEPGNIWDNLKVAGKLDKFREQILEIL
ncbi:MAG: dethiobiotin synthase [bacterium]